MAAPSSPSIPPVVGEGLTSESTSENISDHELFAANGSHTELEQTSDPNHMDNNKENEPVTAEEKQLAMAKKLSDAAARAAGTPLSSGVDSFEEFCAKLSSRNDITTKPLWDVLSNYTFVDYIRSDEFSKRKDVPVTVFDNERQGDESHDAYVDDEGYVIFNHHVLCHMVHRWVEASDKRWLLTDCYGGMVESYGTNGPPSVVSSGDDFDKCPTNAIKKRECPASLQDIGRLASRFGNDVRFGELVGLEAREDEGEDITNENQYSELGFTIFEEDVCNMYMCAMLNGDATMVVNLLTRLYYEIMIHINLKAKEATPRDGRKINQQLWKMIIDYYYIVSATKYLYSARLNTPQQQDIVYACWWCLDNNINHLSEPRPLIFAAIVFCMVEKTPSINNACSALYNPHVDPTPENVPEMLKDFVEHVLKKPKTEDETEQQFMERLIPHLSDAISVASWLFRGAKRTTACNARDMSYIISDIFNHSGEVPMAPEILRTINDCYSEGSVIGLVLFVDFCLNLYNYCGSDGDDDEEDREKALKWMDAAILQRGPVGDCLGECCDKIKTTTRLRDIMTSTPINDEGIARAQFGTYLMSVFRNHGQDSGHTSTVCDTTKMNTFTNLLLSCVTKKNPSLFNISKTDPHQHLFNLKFVEILDSYDDDARKLALYYGIFAPIESILKRGATVAVHMNRNQEIFNIDWGYQADKLLYYHTDNTVPSFQTFDDTCEKFLQRGTVDKNHLRKCADGEARGDEDEFEYTDFASENATDASCASCIVCIDEVSKILLRKLDPTYNISQNYKFVILTDVAKRKIGDDDNSHGRSKIAKTDTDNIPPTATATNIDNVEEGITSSPTIAVVLGDDTDGDSVFIKSPRVNGIGTWVKGFSQEFKEAIRNIESVRRNLIQKLLIAEIVLCLPHTSSKGETLHFNTDTHDIVYVCKPDTTCSNIPIDIFSYILGATDLTTYYREEYGCLLLDHTSSDTPRYTMDRTTAFCDIIYDVNVADKLVSDVLALFLDNATLFNTIITDLKCIISNMMTHSKVISQCICKYGASKMVKRFKSEESGTIKGEVYLDTVLNEMLTGVNSLVDIKPLLFRNPGNYKVMTQTEFLNYH